MKSLVLVVRPQSEHREQRILEFAGWMGVPTRAIAIDDGAALERLVGELGTGQCVALSIETLAFLRKEASPDVLQGLIDRACAELLVFAVGRSEQHCDALSWLTAGAVSGLAPAEVRQIFHIPHSARRFGRTFAGQSFDVKRPVLAPSFELRREAVHDIEPILLGDERPQFLCLKRRACELFLLALAELPDINRRLSPSTRVEDGYDQIIPFLIFLRHCFGDACWHGAEPTAQIIIDDPLLSQTYGFLDYGALRRSMRAEEYGTSIAFIPWNHWRTSRSGTSKIFDGANGLSVCVHGCDHSNREFSETDLGALQWRALTALRRMERHRNRTGVAFDPVMVFPQGKFSSTAISALRTSGYLAAVNTTCFPTNADAEPLTVADFLRPAVTRFFGFPLFQRRYPRRLIDSAFDIFLGRPALIVQHHDDFRDGYARLEEFVRGLHRMEPKLSWGALQERLMRVCMMRSTSRTSKKEVRFFTRRFMFASDEPVRRRLILSKHEPNASAISGVTVDGASVPFGFRDDFLVFEHQAEAGPRVLDIAVIDGPKSPAIVPKAPGAGHIVGVCARRALSELRDNALARHPRLLAAATTLATRLKLTGKEREGVD
jgi:hypothetical protein